MKTMLIVYRILTFILLPIAAILGFADLSLLFLALSNPAVLLPVFAIACIVIYLFTASSFLQKGILSGRACKASLRDWIRVNAFVSIAFAGLVVVEYLTLLSNKEVAGEVVKQAMQQQNIPPDMTAADLEQALLTFLLMFFIFSLLLIAHILLSFKLMKQYHHLFKETE